MQNQPQKLLFIDVETTGVSPEQNGLTQISGCVQVDHNIQESFDYFVRPFPQDRIDEGALQVTGIDRRQLLPPNHPDWIQKEGQPFQDPAEVYRQLNEMLGRYVDKFDRTDKFQFVGYNAHSFDMPFMRRFWEKNDDRYFGSWFWYPCLDVMLVWAQILQEDRPRLTNFKLATVAQHCGIAVDDSRLHDSQYDIELTRLLWLKAQETLCQGQKTLAPGEQGSLF